MEHFGEVPDPRMARTQRHELLDIVDRRRGDFRPLERRQRIGERTCGDEIAQRRLAGVGVAHAVARLG